jgi:hypothetical protein
VGQAIPPYVEQPADWQVPLFDPAKPDGFTDFIIRHRVWMVAMLERELQSKVALKQPRRTSIFDTRR